MNNLESERQGYFPSKTRPIPNVHEHFQPKMPRNPRR